MAQHEQPQWQPIGMLPMLADMLDQQLDEVQDVLDALREARSRPHVMDDATISRVIDSYSEQRDFILAIYPEQTTRWRRAATSASQRAEVERFEALYRQVAAAMEDAVTLARELVPGTIDKILGMGEGELAEALMTGKRPFPDAPAGADALRAAERRKIAEVLDLRMQALVDTRCTDLDCLAGMQEYLPGFKHLMDTASRSEMDRLLDEFPGLHRFVRLLETVAKQVRSGEIVVPK